MLFIACVQSFFNGSLKRIVLREAHSVRALTTQLVRLIGGNSSLVDANSQGQPPSGCISHAIPRAHHDIALGAGLVPAIKMIY
jgi:hypothetical protein